MKIDRNTKYITKKDRYPVNILRTIDYGDGAVLYYGYFHKNDDENVHCFWDSTGICSLNCSHGDDYNLMLDSDNSLIEDIKTRLPNISQEEIKDLLDGKPVIYRYTHIETIYQLDDTGSLTRFTTTFTLLPNLLYRSVSDLKTIDRDWFEYVNQEGNYSSLCMGDNLDVNNEIEFFQKVLDNELNGDGINFEVTNVYYMMGVIWTRCNINNLIYQARVDLTHNTIILYSSLDGLEIANSLKFDNLEEFKKHVNEVKNSPIKEETPQKELIVFVGYKDVSGDNKYVGRLINKDNIISGTSLEEVELVIGE